MQADVYVLDELTEDYMIQDELTDKLPHASPASSLPARHACETVRVLAEHGNIAGAVQAIPEQCQAVLKGQRLLFRLKKQETIEYLRQGTAAGQKQALDCIRQDYASLAEHAYPEAYSEFKHSMLLLIFAEDLENSPVKADWSLEARSQLAGMLCRTLKQHAVCSCSNRADGATACVLESQPQTNCTCSVFVGYAAGLYPSQLALLLRHLLLSYHASHYCVSVAAYPPEVKALPNQLFTQAFQQRGHPSKDLPPFPHEEEQGSSGPKQIVPADGQALVTALGISWEEASHLLKHTHGDLSAAFKNELSAYHLNEKLLDELVWEYAACRGLLSLPDDEGSSKAGESSPQLPTEPTDTLHMTGCTNSKGQMPGKGPLKTSLPKNGMQNKSQMGANKPAVCDRQCSPVERADLAVPCSRKRDAPGPNIGLDQQELQGRDELHKMQRNGGTGISGRTSFLHSPPRKVPRWKGRTPYPFPDPKLPTPPSVHTPATAQQPNQDAPTSASGHLYTASSGQPPDAPGSCPTSKRVLPQRYRLMHQLTQDLEAGEVQRVRQQLGVEVGTDVLQRHPELSFELHRTEFHSLLDEGQTQEALQLLRTQMTPLSQQHPELQPKLQASMSCLLPGGPSSAPAGSSGSPPSSSPVRQACVTEAAGLLQEALRAALGLPQPRLLGLIQMLLSAHEAWYQMQRYKDRFEGLLSIDRLKKAPSKGQSTSSMTADQPSSHPQPQTGDISMADAAGNISSDHENDQEEGHHSDGGMSDSDELVLSEDIIIMTMEVTSLPRHQVIDLLLHNDGDPQAVLAQLFP